MLKTNVSLKLLPYWSAGHWHTQDNSRKVFSEPKLGWFPIAKLTFSLPYGFLEYLLMN